MGGHHVHGASHPGVVCASKRCSWEAFAESEDHGGTPPASCISVGASNPKEGCGATRKRACPPPQFEVGRPSTSGQPLHWCALSAPSFTGDSYREVVEDGHKPTQGRASAVEDSQRPSHSSECPSVLCSTTATSAFRTLPHLFLFIHSVIAHNILFCFELPFSSYGATRLYVTVRNDHARLKHLHFLRQGLHVPHDHCMRHRRRTTHSLSHIISYAVQHCPVSTAAHDEAIGLSASDFVRQHINWPWLSRLLALVTELGLAEAVTTQSSLSS